MADKRTIPLEVEVDDGNSPQTIASLEADIESLKEEMKGLEIGSEAFNKMAAEVKDAQ